MGLAPWGQLSDVVLSDKRKPLPVPAQLESLQVVAFGCKNLNSETQELQLQHQSVATWERADNPSQRACHRLFTLIHCSLTMPHITYVICE